MKQIEAITRQYAVLTDWFISVLENISEEDGSKTIDGANSLEWIAGHLITGRYRNILRIGVQVPPYIYLDRFVNQSAPPPNAIPFDKANKYPGLTESRKQWMDYSAIFLDRLKSIDETTLHTEIPFTVLTGGNTVNDALTFIAIHESYHIGQMSTIRKALGYPAMQLSRRT